MDVDRFSDRPMEDGSPTAVAVAGHPLHPMLVTFPIAFLLATFASDLAYWYTLDAFWARMSLWLVGSGTVMGGLAGLAGAVELLAVSGIRRRGAAWSHFVAAVVMLSVAAGNWAMRIGAAEDAVLPLGLFMSGLTAVLVGLSGWLGGTLVFEHRVGIVVDDGD